MVVIWLPRIEFVVGLLLITGVAAKLVAVFSSLLQPSELFEKLGGKYNNLNLEPLMLLR